MATEAPQEAGRLDDFESLNRLLHGVEWHSRASIPFKASSYDGTLRNINCTSFAIDDMSVVRRPQSDEPGASEGYLEFSSSIRGITAACTMDVVMTPSADSEDSLFSLLWDDMDISGVVSTTVTGGSVDSKGTIIRGHGSLQPAGPTNATRAEVNAADCTATVPTERPGFEKFTCRYRQSGLALPFCSSIFSAIEAVLHGSLEEKLASELCDQVVDITGSGFNASVGEGDALLGPYVSTRLPIPRPFAEDSAVTTAAQEAGVRLVDWQSNFLVGVVRNASTSILSPGFVNAVVQGLTGPGGSIATGIFVPLPLVEKEVSIRAEVDQLTMGGLDTFTLFDPLNEVSPRTLRFSLGLANIRLSAVSSVYIEKSEQSQFSGVPSVVERATVGIELRDLFINVSVMLGLDGDTVANTQFGSFTSDPSGCLSLSVFGTEVTELSVTVGEITPPNITGMISPGLDRVLDQLASLMWAAYEPKIVEAVPAAFEVSVRPLLNSVLQQSLASRVESLCPKYHAQPQQYLRFTGNASVPRFLGHLHDMVHPVSKINHYVAKASLSGGHAGPPGTWRGSPDLGWRSSTDLGPLGRFSFAAGDWRVSNLDSFYDINVLEPDGPHKLVNSIGFANRSVAVLSLRVILSISTGQMDLYDEVEVSLFLSDLRFLSEAFMLIDTGRFLGRPLASLADLHCWLGSLDDAAIEQLVLASGLFALTAVCEHPANCTSPLMLKAESLMKRPGAARRMTDMVNTAFAHLTGGLTSAHAHDELRKLVLRSNFVCEGQPVPPQLLPASLQASEVRDSASGLVASVRNLALLVSLYMLVYCCAPWGRTCGRKQGAEVAADAAGLGATAARGGEPTGAAQQLPPPLYRDPALPRWRRAVVVTAGAIIVPVLLAGHCCVAAHIGVSVRLGGDAPGSTANLNLKSLSVLQTVHELWRHGAFPLAILIGGFSVLWPYVKLVILAFCWFAPPERIGLRCRGSLFEVLDSCGKYSLIDVYVMVVCMVGLTRDFGNPDLVFSEANDAYAIKLWVEPSLGLWCFLAAVLASLGVSTMSICCHRWAAEMEPTARHRHYAQELRSAAAVRQPMCGHAWEMQIPGAGGSRLQLSWAGKHAVTAALLLAGALLSFGAFSPAIGFVTRGLVGSLLQAMEPGSHHIRHSFVSAPLVLLDPNGLSERAPMTAGFIVFCYFMFGLLVPLANQGLLIVLWLVKLTEQNQRRVLSLIKTFTSWSVLEVFIFAVAVSLWELASLSRSIADHHCRSIQPVLDLLVPWSLLDVGVCYEVCPEFIPGSFLLLAGALLAHATTSLVVKACEAAFADLDGVCACDRNLAASSFGNSPLFLRFCLHVGFLRAVPRKLEPDIEHEERHAQVPDGLSNLVFPLLR